MCSRCKLNLTVSCFCGVSYLVFSSMFLVICMHVFCKLGLSYFIFWVYS